MSVDTTTHRSPSGERSPGFDEDVLNTVRVPSDPAQVIVNHVSFRVRLGAGASPSYGGASGTADTPVLPTAVRSAAEARTGRRRAAPVVWSGRTDPGDPAATQLLQALRGAAATQVLPRVPREFLGEPGDGGPRPPARRVVVAPRLPEPDTAPAPDGYGRERPPYDGAARDGSFDGPRADPDPYADTWDGSEAYDAELERRRERRRGEPVRHAWYPGRRMNLGVVLLPLRVFLGFICVYAGLGKLCDPVYFDGGVRGSMVHWLASLHPWSVAEPLRSAALAHPVGAGLTVAFLQVVVGVLTIMGLWQRVAACVGALLSTALLVTVSWRTVPAYDAPDIIYLAAWSPLAIAGAPVYSVDSKLAGEAWRRLGPRAPLWGLRHYVLRRGTVLVSFVAGGSLLVGALFGGAVRAASSHLDVPGSPSDLPTNNLPGSPNPRPTGPGARGAHGRGSVPGSASAGPSAGAKPTTGASAAPGLTHVGSAGGLTGVPGRHRVQTSPRRPAPPARTVPPASTSSDGGSSGASGGSLGGLLGIKPTTGFLLGMPGAHHGPPRDRTTS